MATFPDTTLGYMVWQGDRIFGIGTDLETSGYEAAMHNGQAAWVTGTIFPEACLHHDSFIWWSQIACLFLFSVTQLVNPHLLLEDESCFQLLCSTGGLPDPPVAEETSLATLKLRLRKADNLSSRLFSGASMQREGERLYLGNERKEGTFPLGKTGE